MGDQQLIEQLAAFGIGTIETQIYLYLLGKPPMSILEIAEALSIPRTSVYDNAEKLTNKGLVEVIVQHKSHQLKAFPISILQTHIDKEKARVESLQDKLATLKREFPLGGSSLGTTEVRYYHGSKGLEQMVWNTLRTTDELVGYSQFSLTRAVSRRFVDRYNLELMSRKIPNRIITNPENIEVWREDTKPIKPYTETFQQCRTIPPKELFVSGDTTIYNNVFAIANWEHNEIVGVEIENPYISKVQKDIFNLLWAQSSPVPDVKK